MRALVVAAVVLVGARGDAEPIPPGTLGVLVGPISGSGPDQRRVGAGIAFGAQASWQPTSTERAWGWSVRWSALFTGQWGGNAATVEPLHTVMLDLTIGMRARPWTSTSRYLTLRAGGALLRANEPIPTNMMESAVEGNRAFLGPVAAVGFEQELGGLLFELDVRYGMIAVGGPSELSALVGVAFMGP